MTSDNGTLDRLAACAPGADDLDDLWPGARRDEMRARILSGAGGATVPFVRPHSRPRRRTLAVAAALAAAAAAVLLVGQLVLPSDTPGGSTQAGAATLEGLATAAQAVPADGIRPGQYRFLVDKQSAGCTQHWWTSYNGRTWRRDTCYDGTVIYYRSPERGNDLLNPSPQFLATLPDDPAALQEYLRSRLTGSTSADEAVFAWAGETLYLGYTPPTLRAAIFRVLERTGHITVAATADALGRDAVRVSFIDPVRRPDETQSLFFDPRTSQLVQEQDVFAGQTSTTTYTDSGIAAAVPTDVLVGAADPDQPPPPPPLGTGGRATATPVPTPTR